MVKYTIHYFKGFQGRAEPARILFHMAGIEYTNNDIDLFTEWADQKPDSRRFPLGQMPTMEVDDVVICQSAAIFSYLANEFGYYGNGNMERAVIDQLRECMAEVFEGFVDKVYHHFDWPHEDKVKAMKEFIETEKNKKLLGFLVKQLKSHEGPFFLGDKISVADIILLVHFEYYCDFYNPLSVQYPELAALHDSVFSHELVKGHVMTRTTHR